MRKERRKWKIMLCGVLWRYRRRRRWRDWRRIHRDKGWDLEIKSWKPGRGSKVQWGLTLCGCEALAWACTCGHYWFGWARGLHLYFLIWTFDHSTLTFARQVGESDLSLALFIWITVSSPARCLFILRKKKKNLLEIYPKNKNKNQ